MKFVVTSVLVIIISFNSNLNNKKKLNVWLICCKYVSKLFYISVCNSQAKPLNNYTKYFIYVHVILFSHHPKFGAQFFRRFIFTYVVTAAIFI